MCGLGFFYDSLWAHALVSTNSIFVYEAYELCKFSQVALQAHETFQEAGHATVSDSKECVGVSLRTVPHLVRSDDAGDKDCDVESDSGDATLIIIIIQLRDSHG